LQKLLPAIGAQIVTRDGKARVIGQEILSQQLLVETEDNRRLMIDASEVLSTITRNQKGKEPSKGGEGRPADKSDAEE
jgi:hypothetical protein